MASQDGWKKRTARKKGYGVEVEFTNVYDGMPFWGRKATYTTKAEALADAESRRQAGNKCRVVNFTGEVLA